jgi:hypothetical protein
LIPKRRVHVDRHHRPRRTLGGGEGEQVTVVDAGVSVRE